MRAYNATYSAVAGPAWLDDKYYDILAKAPEGTRPEQIPVMLQRLLAERFRMRVHWEAKEKAGYELVVGKGRLNLTKAKDPGASPSEGFRVSGAEVRLSYRTVSLDRFARSLTVDLQRPVVNMTQIEGLFDIELECASDSLPGMLFGKSAPAASSDPAPSVFAAIRRLGLDLASKKVPDKRLVVDSAESVPTEN
jgi:uncharacterized protein (TIGR03435 family)